ncbi:hypothetical protein JR316_0008848 [Psilocybe cubensis]|uniref:Uncharacterized protein n=2 Tax=Psilocybe cubensis TaxID=181762 RepID=A0ACB8GSF9_PSICU|nr:hypothetical protein JR316_0008848 [Psilocybe cubensis]KAH9478394.1 hypothetical protein JR316_0008848 [Psilocybe cubensis]
MSTNPSPNQEREKIERERQEIIRKLDSYLNDILAIRSRFQKEPDVRIRKKYLQELQKHESHIKGLKRKTENTLIGYFTAPPTMASVDKLKGILMTLQFDYKKASENQHRLNKQGVLQAQDSAKRDHSYLGFSRTADLGNEHPLISQAYDAQNATEIIQEQPRLRSPRSLKNLKDIFRGKSKFMGHPELPLPSDQRPLDSQLLQGVTQADNTDEGGPSSRLRGSASQAHHGRGSKGPIVSYTRRVVAYDMFDQFQTGLGPGGLQ